MTDDDTVPVALTIDRGAAILAGSSRFGRQLYHLRVAELSDADRRTLASFPADDGGISLVKLHETPPLPQYPYDAGLGLGQAPKPPEYPVLAAADLDGVRAVLAAQRDYSQTLAEFGAHIERESSRMWDERQNAWMATPDNELLVAKTGGGWTVKPPAERWLLGLRPYRPTVMSRLTRLNDAARRLDEDARRERQRQEAAAARAEQEAHAARTRALAEVLATLASEEQRRRHARGLLPESELVDLYREQLLRPLEAFAPFRPITPAEVLSEADEEPDADVDVVFDSADAGEADPEEFALLEAIERVVKADIPLPAKVVLRWHGGGIAGTPSWEVQRASVLVTVETPLGEQSREYAARAGFTGGAREHAVAEKPLPLF
jgi:hypothetical protein